MSRIPLIFGCQGLKLAATLDTAPGKTGLLMVSGGNEIRSGSFSGQALLAARIADAGFPVFRFDRRGIGDSDGENRGFRKSAKDIAAAIEAFKALAPQLERIFAFGNCDGASALMLANGDDCDGLILSNPWTFDDGGDGTPPPGAVRARYANKLKNPRELLRLVTGGVNMRSLISGLRQAASPGQPMTPLAREMAAGIADFEGPVRILLAANDRTAQAFEANWPADDHRIRRCTGASHAYAEPDARVWLERQILEMLRS